jgi:hypothetical protein
MGLMGLMWVGVARAEITATVTPGHQFSVGERVTVSTLNLLGTPTIEITGTLGGTNVALGAGTVSGTVLMDSVAGSNLTWNGESPRGLVIANAGVGTNQIAAEIAGTALTGGTGLPLSVQVDTNTITVDAANQLALANSLYGSTNRIMATDADGVITNVTTTNYFTTSGGQLALRGYDSAEYALAAGTTLADVAHGLGATPRYIRSVLVCSTAEKGFLVGDEIDLATGPLSANGPIQVTANATNVLARCREQAPAVLRKDNGSADNITAANWKFKFYARP